MSEERDTELKIDQEEKSMSSVKQEDNQVEVKVRVDIDAEINKKLARFDVVSIAQKGIAAGVLGCGYFGVVKSAATLLS